MFYTYLLLFFQLLYVIEVTDDTNSAKKYIKIVSITEVLLQSPMLNIIIVDAKIDYNDLDLTENHNSSKYFFLHFYILLIINENNIILIYR